MSVFSSVLYCFLVISLFTAYIQEIVLEMQCYLEQDGGPLHTLFHSKILRTQDAQGKKMVFIQGLNS